MQASFLQENSVGGKMKNLSQQKKVEQVLLVTFDMVLIDAIEKHMDDQG